MRHINSYQDSIREGALRELIATKILMEHRYSVSFPFENKRYDLIVEKYPFIARVQVKPLIEVARGNLDKWQVRAFSTSYGKRNTYTREDCDFIMAVTNSGDNFAVVPVEVIPSSGTFPLSLHETCTRRVYLNSFIAFEEMVIY